MNQEEPIVFLENFARLFFTIWVKANANHRVTRLEYITDPYTIDINRKPEIQAKVENCINEQKDRFCEIVISPLKVPVLFSSKGFLVINLLDITNSESEIKKFEEFYFSFFSQNTEERQDRVFLTLKTNQKKKPYLLEISGISYNNETRSKKYEYSQGCKAKYLTYFLLFNKIKLLNRQDYVDTFNREFVNNDLIHNCQIFLKKSVKKTEIYRGEHYFMFCFQLANKLIKEEDIKNNIYFYKEKIKKYKDNFKQLCLESSEKKSRIFINDAIPIDSDIYIERSIDQDCKNIIQEKAAFIRIKGSRKIGKTSLLYRIIEQGEENNYLTIFIDCEREDIKETVFNNVQSFCIWLCREIAYVLNKEDKTNYFWNPNSSHKLSNTTIMQHYFEEEFLTENQPILLVIDNVDKIFENQIIASPICSILASWHRLGKVPNYQGKTWGKLKIVLAHATDVYLGLNINESPLKSIGYIPIIEDWNNEEVKKFACIYNIDLQSEEIKKLQELVVGHPYLVTIAIKYLYEKQGTIDDLLSVASTQNSPFHNYLRGQLLFYLQKFPKYKEAFIQILQQKQLNISNELELEEIEFKLKSLGLVQRNRRGNKLLPKCKLYNDYFQRVLIEDE